MPTIELTDKTYEWLQSLAEPFKDTPESVILRLLRDHDLTKPVATAVSSSRSKRRAQVGTLLPEREYWIPVLRALDERGGEAAAVDVIDRVGEILAERLTADDLGLTTTGETRWRNRTQFARLRMKEQGWINPNSPRGIWAITDEGREMLGDARPRRELE